jgi:hypothetical protein
MSRSLASRGTPRILYLHWIEITNIEKSKTGSAPVLPSCHLGLFFDFCQLALDLFLSKGSVRRSNAATGKKNSVLLTYFVVGIFLQKLLICTCTTSAKTTKGWTYRTPAASSNLSSILRHSARLEIA